MASMRPTMVFVGHGINKCLQWYVPWMYECLQRTADLFDCSYAAMSNHKLTVANLCVKSNSMWTNFADNGKIHTCMYNVCTLYTTAVGVILARQLARLMLVNDWLLLSRVGCRGRWFENAGSRECSVRFAHTAHACRWRSKPNRALVKEGCELFVGHAIWYTSSNVVCWTDARMFVQQCCMAYHRTFVRFEFVA